MKNKTPIRILHLGHLGVGGTCGIAPEGKEKSEIQQWLTETKKELKKLVGIPKKYPDVLIVGGEIIEGRNHKNHGEQIYMQINDQISGAVDVISEFIGKNTKEVIVLYAHRYHASYETRIEEIASTMLKLRFPKLTITCTPKAERTYLGKNLRFLHGHGGGTVYICSSQERNIKMNLQQAALGKVNKIDNHYSYHTHRLATASVEGVKSITCPAFKVMDLGGEMINPDGWLADIGALMTTIEVKYGDVRIRDDPILFKVKNFKQEIVKTSETWGQPIIPKTRNQYTEKHDEILLPK